MTTDPSTQLFDALTRCDREQQRIVAEALRGVLDDVRKAGVYSRSSWVVAGLLDGERPVRESTRQTIGRAREKAQKRRRAMV